MLTVSCSCGVSFLRRVMLEDAERELLLGRDLTLSVPKPDPIAQKVRA